MNKRLNTDIKLVFPFTTVLFKNIIFMGILVALGFAIKYIRVVLLQPEVWFMIAMMTFLICTGGIVYSVIHGVPWFKFERDQYGGMYISEYFMKG
jgi:hypothetical protein